MKQRKQLLNLWFILNNIFKRNWKQIVVNKSRLTCAELKFENVWKVNEKKNYTQVYILNITRMYVIERSKRYRRKRPINACKSLEMCQHFECSTESILNITQLYARRKIVFLDKCATNSWNSNEIYSLDKWIGAKKKCSIIVVVILLYT